MIVLAIISILAAIVYPTYGSYVRRSKLDDATSQLSGLRSQMEQSYQDNRTYRDPANADNCAIADFTSTYFSFSCVSATRTTFVWTASNRADVGLDSAEDYSYTVDQDGTAQTLKYDGTDYSGAPLAGWKTR